MYKKTIEERRGRYRESSDTTKDLYGSESLDQLLNKFIDSLKIPISLKEVVGDTILGFYKTSELPILLQKEVGVSADDAQRIMGDLQEFLAPVIEREKSEVNPNHVELQELQQTFTPESAVVPVTNQITPNSEETVTATDAPQSEVQEPHAPVQAMRTMEGDMSRIHGYGAYRAQFPNEPQEVEQIEEVIRSASQDDLLQEKPKLAGMPTYEEKGEEK